MTRLSPARREEIRQRAAESPRTAATFGVPDLLAELEARDALLEKAREALVTFCPECGPKVNVDEDGCCRGCGCVALTSDTATKRLLALIGGDEGGGRP